MKKQKKRKRDKQEKRGNKTKNGNKNNNIAAMTFQKHIVGRQMDKPKKLWDLWMNNPQEIVKIFH